MNFRYNAIREAANLKTSRAKLARKTYKKIIEELGARNITIENIAHGEKQAGFLDLIDETGATLDELAVLQQYSKAIIDRDTRAAEFLRDSVGEKPSQVIDVKPQSGLSQLSLDELVALQEDLHTLANAPTPPVPHDE